MTLYENFILVKSHQENELGKLFHAEIGMFAGPLFIERANSGPRRNA
jgi:hypothetical protein